MDGNNTDNIEKKIKKIEDYDQFYKENRKDLVSVHPGRYIIEQLEKKKLAKKDIIRCVDLNTSYVYEILREEKKPERDKLLRFVFPLGLDIQEAQTMLKRCGYAGLYAKNPRDSIILFCISRRKTLVDLNILLDKYGFKTL